MPTYDFQCKNKHVTEAIVNYSDMKKGIDCSDCDEKALRIFSFAESSPRPTFGYDMSKFNQREQHRKSMKGSQLNQNCPP